MTADPASDVQTLVANLFRRQAGEMVAALTRIFGPAHLDLAEDVVQDALVQALRRWPFHGIPANPRAWLIEVARNRALDRLRQHGWWRDHEAELRHWAQQAVHCEPTAEDIRDDQLRLMFMCCHPAIPRDAQVALTLKTLCGFGVTEIARAFLVPEATVAQRLVRAKRKIQEERLPFDVPEGAELSGRLEGVLDVLYLWFNEGFSASQGECLVRQDLVEEALRLTRLLLELPATRTPKVHALLALMLFHSARTAARTDSAGNLLLLADQDRSRWDVARIQEGFFHLCQAARGDELSPFHLEAGIASTHALAARYQTTDWKSILRLYDLMLARNPSPIVALNRAVAFAQVHGPEAALAELAAWKDQPALKRYYLLPATRGEFLRQMGLHQEAADCFRQALVLVSTDPERRFLEARLREAEAGEDAPRSLSKGFTSGRRPEMAPGTTQSRNGAGKRRGLAP